MKSTTSCLCIFYIRLFVSDLDTDDNNSLVSEFSGNDDSEIEGVETGGIDEDWRLITVTTTLADEVCITLDKFIRNGVISKERIFYKYLKDTVEYLCNPLHPYDDDVKEFFASVADFAENRTYNFIRGPMEYGQRKCLNKNNLSTAGKCRMNLGAPSSGTRESGVLIFLSLSHYKLCENSCDPKVKPLVLTDNLKVYPVDIGNNGTALKPSIRFDE